MRVCDECAFAVDRYLVGWVLLIGQFCELCCVLLAGGSPAATHLSFASPKESKQRKGDPAVRVPALRFGQPVRGGKSGGPRKLASLRFAQTARGPDPAFAAHHRPSQNGTGGGGFRIGFGFGLGLGFGFGFGLGLGLGHLCHYSASSTRTESPSPLSSRA